VAEIGLLDGAAAADPALLEALRDMVNEAYDRGERGLWRQGSERISTEGLRGLVLSGELAAALEGDDVAGCVRVTSIDRGLAELGLLAVGAEHAGAGIGRALMDFAHDLARARGHHTMRLTLLVPREGTHPFKERLHDWYSRQGYRVVGRQDFAVTHPELAVELLVPCDLLVFERPLG
jgi:GNAT superfamily N-acetyltransferase